MTDETPDAIQPDEGQGGEGTGTPPYAEYLDRIPEEVRDQVEPVFRDWDKNYTQKSQEAAEYRSQWEPYEQLGVNQLPPEELQGLIQFRDLVATNPQAVAEWYQQYAQQYGLGTAPPQQQQEPGVPDQFGEYQDPQLQAQLEQMLEQRLGPVASSLQQLTEWQQQQEQQVREQQAMQYIEGQLADLEKKHGAEFSRERVEQFIANHIESDPAHAVQKAWDDWMALRAQIEKETLQAKSDQPAGAESGGVANGAPDEERGMDAANARALAILKQANANR